MNSKRTYLKLGLLALGLTLVLAITLVLSGVGSAAAGDAATAPELEGTWLATITIQDGPPPFPSLLSYGRGGALIITDSSVSPALGNVYQGTWTKTGAHKYTFTFLGLQYDTSGLLSGYLRGHETLRLQSGGQTYDGVGTVEVLDIGQNVIATGASTSHATRVNP